MKKIPVKGILLGNTGVGKTSFCSSYRDAYKEDQNSTATALCSTFAMEGIPGSENHTFQLWDTAGQEQFKSLAPNYIRDADIVFIFTACEETIEKQNEDDKQFEDYILQVYDQLSEGSFYPAFVLNKTDLINSTELTAREEQIKAKVNEIIKGISGATLPTSIQFFSISCKQSMNIEETFIEGFKQGCAIRDKKPVPNASGPGLKPKPDKNCCLIQ